MALPPFVFVRGVGYATSVLVRICPLKPTMHCCSRWLFREVWLDVIHAVEKRLVFLCGFFYFFFLKKGKKTSPQTRKIVFYYGEIG